MRERPILFSAPMVRAILAGAKTQTRRIMKHQPQSVVVPGIGPMLAIQQPRSENRWLWPNARDEVLASCPYGQPGDRLWVRETWAETDTPDGTPVVAYRAGGCVAIGRDGAGGDDMLIRDWAWDETPATERWRPSIHMPRWASRIDLEVTGVRVERLQDISEADCWAEGIEEVMNSFTDESQYATAKRLGASIEDAKPLYCQLWESISGPESWDANPFVWVVEFARMPE